METESDGTRWRTGGEVKGKEANGVGSQQSSVSLGTVHPVLEWKRNLVAHGDAREEKWRGKRRMGWVASSLQLDSEQSIQCYYNRSPPTRTPRKPVLDWTDTPADINGLVRFAGRPNLVSALVPSHSVFTLQILAGIPTFVWQYSNYKLTALFHILSSSLCIKDVT